MKSFSRSGEVDQVLRLFQEMKNSRFCPNVLCYNTVINALVMAGRFEEAEAVFEELILSGLAPNVASYNILVKLHSCFSNRFDLAYEVIRRMMKCGYRPDATTYSTLISGLCRAGRIEEAWDVLDWMLEEKCPPTVHTYTPIVQGYCSEGRVEEAQKLMATMESIGCPPNSVTYNLLIKALCKNGSFDEVERLIRESSLKSWKPNAVTYNTYMNGLCKMGRAKEAFEQLEVMLGNGLYPTAITLNIILDCLCRDLNIWEARCLLERSSEFGWDVGIVGYNTLMSRLYETGGWLMVLMLFIHILKKGINPNTRTFNILIQSLCKGGKLRMAKSVLHGRGFLANVVTYNILLHWFYEQGNINEVRLLYSSMNAEKIAPDTITYTIMIKGLCREGKFTGATDCFIRSLEGRLDRDMFVVLIHRLVKGRRLKEMLYLFEGMVRQGCVTDGFIFDSVIRSFCKSGFCQSEEIYNVCLILDKMLRTR